MGDAQQETDVDDPVAGGIEEPAESRGAPLGARNDPVEQVAEPSRDDPERCHPEVALGKLPRPDEGQQDPQAGDDIGMGVPAFDEGQEAL